MEMPKNRRNKPRAPDNLESSAQSSIPASRSFRWLYPLIAVWFVTLVVSLIHDSPGCDYWYHLFLGERIFESGKLEPTDTLIITQPSYVNIYWLFQLALRGTYALHPDFGPRALLVSLWLVTASFWLGTLRPLRWPALGALLIGTALTCWQIRVEYRPEAISYAGLAMMVWFTTCLDWRRPLRPGWYVGMVAVEWVWAQCHGYFALGPAIVGARFAVALVTQEGDALPRRRLALAFGIVSLAAIASPIFPRHITSFIHMSGFLEEMRIRIQEFMAPTHAVYMRMWQVKVFWGLWGVTLVALIGHLVWPRRDWFAIILTAAGLYLSAAYFRNIPLLPLLSAPLWRYFLGAMSAAPRLRSRFDIAVSAATLAALSGLTIWIVNNGYNHSRFSERAFGIGVSRVYSPVDFVNYWRKVPFQGKLFNNSSDGGYLEFFLPNLRIYGDSRFSDAIPVGEFFSAMDDPVAFERLHARHQFDAALVLTIDDQVLARHLFLHPDWRLAYADLTRALFVNLKTEEGRRIPDWLMADQPLYRGEDLRAGDNGTRAYQWTLLIASVEGRRDLLVEVLRQFQRAPAIHPGIALAALQYGQAHRDAEIVAIVSEMRPKIYLDGSDASRRLNALFARG